ncbi:hypothetical protein [Nocardia wallacei]|uniref:hypothetical protein n=1 Tax=Nocardia wallacei TaxID=480035 RepID=UPI002455DB0E|nr:hypothetical protein [Nocardia wallacei]
MPITTADQLALAKRVRDQIAAHPEQHDQTLYIKEGPDCGTVACIAGWTAHLHGAPLLWHGQGVRSAGRVATGIDPVSIDYYAAHLLGLDSHEALRLFNPDIGEAEARARLEELIADGEAAVSGASR